VTRWYSKEKLVRYVTGRKLAWWLTMTTGLIMFVVCFAWDATFSSDMPTIESRPSNVLLPTSSRQPIKVMVAVGASPRLKERNAMPRLLPSDWWGALTVHVEASNQTKDGKVAVAEVIRERARKKLFSDGTVEGTVFFPLQFSCWNTHDPNRVRAARADFDDSGFRESADAWFESARTSLVHGATHYYNPNTATPAWGAKMIDVVVVGDHRFGKLP